MKEELLFIMQVLVGLSLFFLLMIWGFGFILGFSEKANCYTGRIIADNWFTGLGYQLSCKR